ncbi:unnamed protein product [Polarella glacialis]|uniref:Uncharacterized protein n=1 Tax=Polarella glacialis TaxID=89957 RepID=A0A813LU36_POLGL|nr:unnamed protein product [Polarella glacialis]
MSARRLANLCSLMLVVDGLAESCTGTMLVENKAELRVSLRNYCGDAITLAPGESRSVTLDGTNNKHWVMKEGFEWDCNLDCLDCFYVAANVACSGAVVVGIGYGHNDPVVVHDGILGLLLEGKNEVSKELETVECTPSSCSPQHILPGLDVKITILAAMAVLP